MSRPSSRYVVFISVMALSSRLRMTNYPKSVPSIGNGTLSSASGRLYTPIPRLALRKVPARLIAHPAAEAAVTRVPDDEAGKAPKTFAVLKRPAPIRDIRGMLLAGDSTQENPASGIAGANSDDASR